MSAVVDITVLGVNATYGTATCYHGDLKYETYLFLIHRHSNAADGELWTFVSIYDDNSESFYITDSGHLCGPDINTVLRDGLKIKTGIGSTPDLAS